MSDNSSATGGYLTPVSPRPAEDDELADALQAMVVGITALPASLVRPRWQVIPPKQPANNVDWCAIGPMGDDPAAGRISSRHIADGEGSSETIHDTTFNVRASFYGPNASGFAKLLRDGLMIAQNREELFRQGMALVASPGATTKTAELVNNQFVGRCDISFDIRRRVSRVWAIKTALGAAGVTISDAANPSQEPFQVPEG